MPSSYQIVIAAILAAHLGSRPADASLDTELHFSEAAHIKANLTKATLVQDYELMLNKTKAALADLETLADELAAAKSAKLNKAAKSVKLNKAAKSVKLNKTATLKPGMSAAHSAKVASFAQADAGAKPDAVVSLDCSDEVPKDAHQFSCQQQRDWGKCGEGWMVATDVFKHGYCAKTCGRC